MYLPRGRTNIGAEGLFRRRRYAIKSNSNKDATIAAMRGSRDQRRARVARGQSECGSFTSTKARMHSAIMWN
jgi:hypothetical protein